MKKKKKTNYNDSERKVILEHHLRQLKLLQSQFKDKAYLSLKSNFEYTIKNIEVRLADIKTKQSI